MRKLGFAVSVFALALLVLAQQDVLWSRLQFLDAPRVYVVQKGESLSKLAQEHYGNTDYWRELALVNRAPEPNHIQPGEEILLPAANVIQELRRAHTISRVNDLVNAQHALAAHVAPAPAEPTVPTAMNEPTTAEPIMVAANHEAPAAVVTPVSAVLNADPANSPALDPYTDEPVVEDSSSSWFWVIFGALALSGVIGFVVYRRRQEEEELAQAQNHKLQTHGDTKNFQLDRRPQGNRKVERVVM